MKPGGVVAMNVIGDAINLASITLKFRHVFGNVHVLATDPNYFFYAVAQDHGTGNGPTSATPPVSLSPDEVIPSTLRSRVISCASFPAPSGGFKP